VRDAVVCQQTEAQFVYCNIKVDGKWKFVLDR